MIQSKTEDIKEFKYYSVLRKTQVNIPDNLKHILIFGQSRQGKSSMINMMINKNKDNGAPVSDSIKGCTFSTEPYYNNKYCFWDTTGLNEQDNGTVMNTEATKNLIKFIKESKGFHGAIMVVSWNNINSVSTKRNWDLFYNVFLDQRIPIIICITGRGTESANSDQIWIDQQNNYIKSLGYTSKNGKAHKCVIYSKDNNEIDEDFLTYYTKLKQRSTKYICDLLDKNITNIYYNPLNEMTWFDIFKKIHNTIMDFFGLKDFMITIREEFKRILVKMGFSGDEAENISKETY